MLTKRLYWAYIPSMATKNIPIEKKKRLSWDEYFMQITRLASERSTCLRRNIGAVITKNNRILSTGYNGAPSGMAHCLDIGCLRDKLKIPSGTRHEICRGLHAEQNALMFAQGADLHDAVLYCTNQPCIVCTKLIIQAGIRTVIFEEDYPDELARAFLLDSGVKSFKLIKGKRVKAF
jgi:dCMP deaminase